MSADATTIAYALDATTRSLITSCPPTFELPDMGLYLYDRKSGKERLLEASDKTLVSVAIRDDNQKVATGHRDGTLHILDVNDGEVELELVDRMAAREQRLVHEGDVHCMEFSSDGKRLIAGGDNARVVVWDLESGEEVMALQPHESYVHAVAYSPHETRILSGSGDRTLRIWDSVPLRERTAEIQRLRNLRARFQPRVDALLDEHGSPEEVSRILRADPECEGEDLLAALRCLLEKTRP